MELNSFLQYFFTESISWVDGSLVQPAFVIWVWNILTLLGYGIFISFVYLIYALISCFIYPGKQQLSDQEAK